MSLIRATSSPRPPAIILCALFSIVALLFLVFASMPEAADTAWRLNNDTGQVIAGIDDQGNFISVGAILENQSSPLSLNPARHYWTLTNDAGAIVTAIDTENGDLLTLGQIQWGQTPTMSNAIFQVFNSSGALVIAIGPAGDAQFNGPNPQQPPATPN
ncbi:MAG: hypothetical protein NTX50_14270, partial [Candidatus Sumerlaeota bacterium]|nr:hypothetical protein [Candidatus Sumerlaeota bacterium]